MYDMCSSMIILDVFAGTVFRLVDPKAPWKPRCRCWNGWVDDYKYFNIIG